LSSLRELMLADLRPKVRKPAALAPEDDGLPLPRKSRMLHELRSAAFAENTCGPASEVQRSIFD
jgi:hypothetical protein